jgi:hypothetical protein
MEMGYLGSLLPALAEADCDLRIHYEIKANLRRPQLQALYDAGVILVQPGIESFSSHVLKLMNKGVTGCLNMRLLRDAESVGIAPSWNYLYGFPGERPSDYAPIIEQLPALHHLPPPAGCSRIGIERFSPYFARPELGFTPLRPAPQYSVTYDLPQGELNDLAYLFSAPDRGIGDDLAELLTESISDWASAHCDSRLTHCDRGDEIVLVNRREGFPWEVVRLGDPVELAAFRLLDQPRTVPALTHLVRGQTGRPVAGDEIGALLARWQRLGVVFAENDHFIQIAPEATNRELTRINRPTVRSRE